MVENAEALGTQVTTDADSRVTPIGRFLRKYRLDELPQVFNVLGGSMSFVGTRPEVPRYVEQYKDEYYATLLLPAGITSLASIMYKDEEKLLSSNRDADSVYIEKILPEKMKYNLKYVRNFGFFTDIGLMFKTVIEVIK
jgi:lipopolysaccharide/colanic/teichoic acid biosynthesis glycosyltransferase